MDITKASLALPVFWGGVLFLLLSTRSRGRLLPARGIELDKDFTNTLKGVATFLVLYHHTYLYHPDAYWYLFAGGEFFSGVSLFFFISGVGLALSQEARPRGVAAFLAHRFRVLAPVVFLSLQARALLGPLMGRDMALELSPLTLLGMREWFLVAIWAWYLIFILSACIASKPLRHAAIALTGGALWAVLQWNADQYFMAAMWLRFPLSFMLGVLLADRMKTVTRWLQAAGNGFVAPAVMLLCGAGYFLIADGVYLQTPLGYAAMEVLIIPASWALCVLLLKYVGVSRFLTLLGIYSLPIYLLQVPLLRYGVWFSSGSGALSLLATWAGIIALAVALQEAVDFLRKAASSLSPFRATATGRLK
ncbi:acyltransferase [Desulfovibrio mangrovi]|uniref:acyltransferase family protein n=1 Tax=Desulfovibrio mangrovi TaxID=2976983 RepID=UPI002246E6E9|nr:acyltransferase family protein [Desulfovibrio mangrovi]UZP67552.1 acyltransferase [Desulfovibrio mangrovi]